MSYTYDGNGERVLKSQTVGGAAVKRYWSTGGNTLAEADGSGNLTAEYIYFGSQRIARIDLPAGSVHYYLSDHLKSTSMVVSAAGAIEEDSDYSSFGTEYVNTGAGVNRYKFTSKERDSETGLDYFGARYYGNALGRFLTPDWAAKAAAVPYAEFADPQSLNLYTYVRNVPTSRFDADGHQQIQNQACPAQNSVNNFATKPEDPVEALKGAGKQIVNVVVNTANLLIGKIGGGNLPLDNPDQHVGANAMNQALAAAPLLNDLKISTAVVDTAVAKMPSVMEQLQGAANDAVQNLGPGSGRIYGTLAHSEFADLVDSLGNPNLSTEISYKGGVQVPYGTPGSIRVDVVEGPLSAPTAVYDLKTGSSTLTPARIQQIQSHIPGGGDIPVQEIRPQPQ